MTHTTMLVADSKEWQKRAKQCFMRSITQQRDKYRKDNEERALAYIKMLAAIGVSVSYSENGVMEFTEPSEYRLLTTDVIQVIAEQKKRLEHIGKRRVEV